MSVQAPEYCQVGKKNSNQPPEPSRDRIDLRADSAWVSRVERQAKRLGLSVSAYIRQAVTLKLEDDEAREPQSSEEG